MQKVLHSYPVGNHEDAQVNSMIAIAIWMVQFPSKSCSIYTIKSGCHLALWCCNSTRRDSLYVALLPLCTRSYLWSTQTSWCIYREVCPLTLYSSCVSYFILSTTKLMLFLAFEKSTIRTENHRLLHETTNLKYCRKCDHISPFHTNSACTLSGVLMHYQLHKIITRHQEL